MTVQRPIVRHVSIGTIVLCVLALVFLAYPVSASAKWSTAQAENLARWIERARGEGLELPKDTTVEIRRAIDGDDVATLDGLAGDAAMMLMRAWRGQCCGERRQAWWHIDGAMSDAELEEGLASALVSDRLDLFLRSVRPSHQHYEALMDELVVESDANRRAVLQANLARWRWMPARLGDRYLLVNIASQHLTLWYRGRVIGRWRVIVGKRVTKTPVFATDVEGVVLNPWWEIPSSIAAEGISSLVRRNPAAARARGYVYQNGRYRQMPGDNNALGRLKLVMPNPYSVFLHDTSNRELFAEDRRVFSHGCIRVDRALSFAARLLARDGWTQQKVESEVATGATQTVLLSEPIPLYVTYFTAERAPTGEVRYYEDIYGRDPVVLPTQSRAATDIYGSHVDAPRPSLGKVTGAAQCLD